MFGGITFAGAPFAGVPITAGESAAQAAPAGRPAKKKKIVEDDGSWPGMIWPQENPRPKVPVVEPSTGVATPPPIAPAVKRPARTPGPAFVKAIAAKAPELNYAAMHRAILERRAFLERQRREREDEELLFLMGVFDE